MKNKIFLSILMIALIVTLTACSVQKIEDIKSDSYIDKTVNVKGTVKGATKMETFSGYTLEDETGSIGVVSDNLPKEGSTTTAKGTLKKFLVVYYIDAKN